MLIKQSRKQYFIELFFTQGALFITSIIGISLTIYLTNAEPNYNFIYGAIGVPLVIGLWLTAFNSGKSKIIENGLKINEIGIHYLRFDKTQTISWQQYNGYQVSDGMPKNIRIKNKAGQDIVFSYHTFSALQRQKIQDRLG